MTIEAHKNIMVNADKWDILCSDIGKSDCTLINGARMMDDQLYFNVTLYCTKEDFLAFTIKYGLFKDD